MLNTFIRSSAPHRPLGRAMVCLALLTACQGAPDQQEGTGPAPTSGEADPRAMRAAGPGPAPQYLHRQVKKCELDMMRSDFASYFRSGPSASSLANISPAYADANWRVLDSLVNVASPYNASVPRAIWVTYGIKASTTPGTPDQFSFGFSVATLSDPNADSTEWTVKEVPDHFYARNAQGAWADLGSASNWSDDEAYMARVNLMRASDVAIANIEPVQNGFDTKAYLMQWDGELVKLMDDNKYPPTIRFSCTSIQKELVGQDQYDLRHYLTAVAVDENGTELVNDDAIDHDNPFLNKAADVGSPCPAACANRVQFPLQGAQLRSACP